MIPLEEAYERWDRLASAMPKRPGFNYLEAEAKALNLAIHATAVHLRVTPAHLLNRLAQVRAAGVEPRLVVRTAIESIS